MNKAAHRDTASVSARTDTLLISVQASEKIINYDSIFRSQSTYLPGTPLAGSGRPGSTAPRTAPSGKEPAIPDRRTGMTPGPRASETATIRHQDDYLLQSGLAGRSVMTGGLILILTGVVLELFVKRKGRTLLALGLAALLGGLLLL